MKKSIFSLMSALVVLLSPGLCRAAEEEPHPEITLMDYDGNAYHFQQGRTDADGNIIVGDDLDSRLPWLVSRGMYGKW